MEANQNKEEEKENIMLWITMKMRKIILKFVNEKKIKIFKLLINI
jgi:hypothetical protein